MVVGQDGIPSLNAVFRAVGEYKYNFGIVTIRLQVPAANSVLGYQPRVYLVTPDFVQVVFVLRMINN